MAGLGGAWLSYVSWRIFNGEEEKPWHRKRRKLYQYNNIIPSGWLASYGALAGISMALWQHISAAAWREAVFEAVLAGYGSWRRLAQRQRSTGSASAKSINGRRRQLAESGATHGVAWQLAHRGSWRRHLTASGFVAENGWPAAEKRRGSANRCIGYHGFA
jgi:hypothetical protein